ncbi:YggT family protein [Acinetobacter rudis]|uniref:YggT family protein n=1 Tax=Acinetobacter rudis TaxID=632955 RepID=A0AAW8J755_9GAMM|nr:YggT family protein [Acinetobacter rudis]MDQ8934953.1 YggT family protein [Acinetobacter rudis]MDQ8952821.1 YggT family protein [Acinetobacter rudis]MDQ9017354.1 YggT family protein [Acinetobacter rudis]
MAQSADIFAIIMNVAILLVFFRFLMQLAVVNPYNPVVMSTIKATKVVDVFSRIFPTIAKGRVNIAALILLLLLCLLKKFGVMHLSGLPLYNGTFLLVATLMESIQSLIRILKYLIFATIILSWVVMFTQSRSPYIEVVQELTEPLLAPFRRILPNMGMIDLSPILAILALVIADRLMSEVAIRLLSGF